MEEQCDDSVFPLTMNYIDRILVQMVGSLRASQFQLVGAVCLFIASKLRDCSESVSLSANKLTQYSDSSFTSRQLIVRSSVLSRMQEVAVSDHSLDVVLVWVL